MSKPKLAVLAAAVAAVAAGSAAYASIPDGSGVIHACYGKPGSNRPGAVRVIDSPGESCAASENPLSWNQAGQPGQPGTPGVSGYEIVAGDQVNIAAGQLGGGKTTCPQGKEVLSGGYSSTLPVATSESAPSGPTEWQVNAKNLGAQTATVYLWAVCADVSN